MSNPYDLYKFLIEPLRTADQPVELLQRFLQGEQSAWNDIYDKINQLPDLTDWESTPDKAVRFLLHHVGFTKEFDGLLSSANLTTNDLRRLASVAMSFWKQRGTSVGIKNLIRFFFNRHALLFDYFTFRWLLEEAAIDQAWQEDETWLIQPGLADIDDYWSVIFVEDIQRNIDTTLLFRFLNLERPSSERFRVIMHDLLEEFDDIDRWQEKIGPGARYWEGGHLVINSTSGPASVLFASGAPSDPENTWQDFLIQVRARLVDDGGGIVGRIGVKFRVSQDRLDFYEVTLDYATQTINLKRFTSGAPSVLATASAPLDIGVWYTITIHCQNTPGIVGEPPMIRIFQDGALVIDFTDVDDAIPIGTMAVSQSDIQTTNRVQFDWVRVQPIPATIISVTP